MKKTKKNMINNFSKQEKLFALKFSSQKSNLKKSAKESKSAILLEKSTIAIKRSIKTSSLENYAYLNSKFRSTSKKSERWIGQQHKLQAFSKKLIDNKQIVIAKERHYWSYQELRHQVSDKYCLNKTKTFNTAKIEKVENSEFKEENIQFLLKIVIKKTKKNINDKINTKKQVNCKKFN